MSLVDKQLTVGELISLLQEHDPDLPVVTDNDFESRCSDYISSVKAITVQESDPESEYYENIPGHVGQPRWMGQETPEFQVVSLGKSTRLV